MKSRAWKHSTEEQGLETLSSTFPTEPTHAVLNLKVHYPASKRLDRLGRILVESRNDNLKPEGWPGPVPDRKSKCLLTFQVLDIPGCFSNLSVTEVSRSPLGRLQVLTVQLPRFVFDHSTILRLS